MEILDFNRINDFILNSEDTKFNFYKQREYIQPSKNDIKAVYDYLLYVAINKYNVNIVELIKNQQLKSLIPNDFLKKCDNFNDALKEINSLKSYLSTITWYNSVFRMDESLNDLFERFESNLCSNSIGGGEKFFSSKLDNQSYHHDQRLYIPCNSEYCHKFARLIIEKSLKYNLPFEFKIMNVENMQNGSDNIVMYIKCEKFKNYVDMINEIISENPDITFGKTHMFGYQINDYISLAPELGGNSYSGHMERLVDNMISEYGRTVECSEIIYDHVVDILNEYNIVNCNVVDILNEYNIVNCNVVDTTTTNNNNNKSTPITDEQLNKWLQTEEGMNFLKSITSSNNNDSSIKLR